MPKYITHWILAEKAYQGLNDQSVLKQSIARGKTSYLMGSVVPDTPFYLIYGKDGRVMNGIAESLHDTRNNSFRFLADVAADYEHAMPEPIMAMLLGIITHIYADAVFHPFVYYFSGPPMGNSKIRKKSAARHHTLETYLDLYVKKEFQVPHQGKFSAYLKHMEIETPRFLEILARLFAVSGEHGLRMIKKSIRMNAVIQGLFDKRSPRLLLDCLNLVPGIDMAHFKGHFYPYLRPDPDDLFQSALEFRHPVTGAPSLFSVERFIDLTVQRVLEAFYDMGEAYKKNEPLSAVFNRMKGPNLYTGRHNCGKADMTIFDTSKDVLALVHGNF
jgi:Zinc dependent phospholipase C